MQSASDTSQKEADILVKDLDGRFKVFSDGQLRSITDTVASVVPPTTIIAVSKNFKTPAEIPADEHFLPLPKNVTAGPDDKAAFAFHPDDHADIEAELAKINTFLTSSGRRKYSVEKIAEKLIEKNSLKLNPEQLPRFIKILMSYFHQARNLVQTKELLIQDNASGLALSPELADKIMIIVRTLRDKIEQADGVVVEAANETVLPETASPEPVAKPEVTPVPVEKVVPPVPQPVAKPVVLEQPKVEAPKPTVAVISDNDLPRVSRPSSDIARQAATLPSAGKGGVKVMGRIDELANMSLVEFRQLDPDPRIRVAKILQRINNLGKESLTRKSQGIEAWRSNEVYRMYLEIGHISLDQSKEITQVMADLETSGKSALNLDEFEAITDLNKNLRF